MSELDDDLTIIEIIKGDQNSGSRRHGLTDAQKVGLACLVCQGTEALNKPVGWVNANRVKVHSFHLINYQHGEMLPPEHGAVSS